MNTGQLKYIGWGSVFLVFQIIFFRHLEIFHIRPDIIIIFLVWYMSRQNRTPALLMAAFLGLGQDFFLDLWGLNMFTKTLLVYSVSSFIPEAKKIRLSIGQIFLTVLLVATLHNLIFQGLNVIIHYYSGEVFFWRHLVGNSLYTAVVASFMYLFRVRQ